MIRFTAVASGMIALALPVVACSASSRGSDDEPGVTAQGTGGERRYPIDGFDSIGLGTSATVDVRVGPAFSVTATGAPAALDKLRVYKQGSSLEIDQRRNTSLRNEKIRFTVTMPRIGSASIGGSGSMAIDRAEGDRFEGNIGGSGSLDVRGVKVDKAEFAVGGSGTITAAGAARSVEISMGGSGSVHSAALTSDHAEVSIAGSGDVQANARRTAEVNIVGSGDVTIGGGAKCEVNKMGSGSVRCG